MPLTDEERTWAENKIAGGASKDQVFGFLADRRVQQSPGMAQAQRAGSRLGEVLTGKPDAMANFGPQSPPLTSNVAPANQAGAEAIRQQQGLVGPNQVMDELVKAGGKMMGAYGGGEAMAGMFPGFPALASVAGQAGGQGGLEAVYEKAQDPRAPVDWRRVGLEALTAGGPGLVHAGIARAAGATAGMPQSSLDYAFANPKKAFTAPTTAERVSAVESLQRGAEDALAHPSPGKNRLNFIIDQADAKRGTVPRTSTARKGSPPGMIDGRALVTSLRDQIKGAGDSATRAAEQTMAGEANDMLGKVATAAANHPENAPGQYYHGAFTAPGGARLNLNPAKPLWITHREYDTLLREHLTKPSTPQQQSAAPTITTQEETANSLRDAARGSATRNLYGKLNSAGVSYPSASGPISAKQAGLQAKNYMQTIERIKALVPRGKPSKPATGGVQKSTELGDAMFKGDPTEVGFRFEQALKDYDAATGDHMYDKFREIAIRGEFTKSSQQPYLANMARIIARPGGASVSERVPVPRAQRLAGFEVRRTLRPGLRSPIASGVGAATQDRQREAFENAMRNSP